MNKRPLKFLLLLTLLLWGVQPQMSRAQAASRARGTAASPARPKLVIQITVDQLRGDEPFRYRQRFVPRGFRYLMERGVWYTSATHPHSHTVTAAGHTTLATGAYPSRHGIIADGWFDTATGQPMNAFKDTQYPLVGASAGSTGASPRRILTSTLSDELNIATGGRAKVFAVSVKDRGAVPMAGHAGKAFWFSTETGEFVSSTYYYKSYPAWVTGWNGQKRADAFSGQSWNLLYDRATYLYAQLPLFAQNLFGYGNTFPHPFGTLDQKPPLFYTKLTVSPVGDDLTLQFAEELIRQEGLGADEVPDYLGISFSSTDFVGHIFGPSSLEGEDNLLRLDRTLASLFSFIDRRVGLDNTLIVLSGDHGAPEVSGYLALLGINTGQLTQQQIADAGRQALKDRYGRDDLVSSYNHPYFYLNRALIESAKLDEAEAERVVAKAVMTLEGIAFAVSCSDLRMGGEAADAELIAAIRRNQHPKRSGDVYVVQQAGWEVQSPTADEPPSLIDHGSPWAYDAYVPVVFAGMNLPAAHVSRPIYTVDVAATLRAFLTTNQPSGSAGSPLAEVLAAKRQERRAQPARTPGAGRRTR